MSKTKKFRVQGYKNIQRSRKKAEMMQEEQRIIERLRKIIISLNEILLGAITYHG